MLKYVFKISIQNKFRNSNLTFQLKSQIPYYRMKHIIKYN